MVEHDNSDSEPAPSHPVRRVPERNPTSQPTCLFHPGPPQWRASIEESALNLLNLAQLTFHYLVDLIDGAVDRARVLDGH